ncbi:MAG: Asp-tRNA(Asn)/Glu-tRNA(Gln) amidotransferase subunit GatB [Parcubacteria group bacterium]|nr:Asp-tRNA(Asn)/Glu-tRNA(Gln) amidotransferase subunit GatB [Parcubacteria group bacterium]
MEYVPVIGLEIHLQLGTRSKMFCRCKNPAFSDDANTSICEVCTGQPGALPTMNAKAVEMVIAAGLALECEIASETKFDRKNYFYPDLPKGYQISQYDMPIASSGKLILDLNEKTQKNIRIKRIHLEEDTAKLMHTNDTTLVDFNRSGVPLMELVTYPDISSASEAKLFCQALQRIFRTIKISRADMEKGQMRCEANISILPSNENIAKDFGNLGTKVEVKNLNSFRSVERAIEYEVNRQIALVSAGESLLQETRGWDEDDGQTFGQRTKEEASDYRYFPEPDIPPLALLDENNGEKSDMNIASIRRKLPELPRAKRMRFQNEYGFDFHSANILAENATIASFAEQTISELEAWVSSSLAHQSSPLLSEKMQSAAALPLSKKKKSVPWEDHRLPLMKLVSSWITTKLFKLCKDDHNESFEHIKISPENFAELLTLLYLGKINGTAGFTVLAEMYRSGIDPSQAVQKFGLEQIDDEEQLSKFVLDVIKNHPRQVEEYNGGKKTLFPFFIGQVMKRSQGNANPEKVGKILTRLLS